MVKKYLIFVWIILIQLVVLACGIPISNNTRETETVGKLQSTYLAQILATANAPKIPTPTLIKLEPLASFTVPPLAAKSGSIISTIAPMAASSGSTFPIAVAACIPTGAAWSTGIVSQVVDGDTIHVLIEGKEYKLRYIGMDTPESTIDHDPYGPESSNKNKELVDGKQVTLIKDTSETDKYGRLLRYVFVGNLFVNYELVRQGYASAKAYPPDTACHDYLTSAQSQAQASLMGIWGLPTPAVAFTVAPVPAQSGNCSPAYPTVCIAPPPPDLDCKDISFRRFKVLAPDPHNFDGDHDGIGCES
jgi:micrococcal nuclease